MTQGIFTQIYAKNGWTSKESKSGPGSTLHQTSNIRLEIPVLLNNYSVQSVLDIPCGDYNWWPHMDIPKSIKYIGADIVPEIITANRGFFPTVDFRILDIINDDLPKVDLVFSRDCLGHLSNANVEKALANIKKSGSKYLLATSFFNPHWKVDADIKDGGWRPINLAIQFKLGEPLLYIDERLMEAEGAYRDKSLGLWRIN